MSGFRRPVPVLAPAVSRYCALIRPDIRSTRLASGRHVPTFAHQYRQPEAARVRYGMLIALLCFVAQSTVAPVAHWGIGAWSPTHSHISLRGVPVPTHLHPWEARAGSDQPACATHPPSTKAAAEVVCTADSTATDSVTAPIHLGGAVVAMPAPPTAEMGPRSPASHLTSSVVVPVPLPPPIA